MMANGVGVGRDRPDGEMQRVTGRVDARAGERDQRLGHILRIGAKTVLPATAVLRARASASFAVFEKASPSKATTKSKGVASSLWRTISNLAGASGMEWSLKWIGPTTRARTTL